MAPPRRPPYDLNLCQLCLSRGKTRRKQTVFDGRLRDRGPRTEVKACPVCDVGDPADLMNL